MKKCKLCKKYECELCQKIATYIISVYESSVRIPGDKVFLCDNCFQQYGSRFGYGQPIKQEEEGDEEYAIL